MEMRTIAEREDMEEAVRDIFCRLNAVFIYEKIEKQKYQMFIILLFQLLENHWSLQVDCTVRVIQSASDCEETPKNQSKSFDER